MEKHKIYERPAGGRIIADVVAKHPGKGHPRVVFTNDTLGAFRRNVEQNAYMRSKWELLKTEMDEILEQPPIRYKKYRHRMLATCRAASDRIFGLAISYQITGDSVYADRLWQEVSYICTVWPNWNPYHFLDTGAMTLGVAVAYDWLYDYWTPEQKEIMERAIIDRGITETLKEYLDLPRERAHGVGKTWAYHNNWSFVCTGSVMAATLAICDEKPEYMERCAVMLGMGIQELEGVLSGYGPDGAYVEGVAYWTLANQYLAYFASTLLSSTGNDYGILKAPGLDKTGDFPYSMLGPGGTFNFSDSPAGYYAPFECLWFARQYRKPEIVALYRKFHEEMGYGGQDLRRTINELLFYPVEFENAKCDLMPDRYYRRLETLTVRDSWDMQHGYFIGLHAGENGIPHYHMDCGQFVLDMNGKRFALDLGQGTYNEPGLWHRYRYSAQGHNTWVINPDDRYTQMPTAKTVITKHSFGDEESFGIADISEAYEDVIRLRRGVFATEGKKVFVVQDEIEMKAPASAYWQMHTEAEVEILPGGKRAILTIGEDRVLMSLLTDNNAHFALCEAKPYENTPYYPVSDNDSHIRKIVLHFEEMVKETVAVEFRYLTGEEIPETNAKVVPLDQWEIGSFR